MTAFENENISLENFHANRTFQMFNIHSEFLFYFPFNSSVTIGVLNAIFLFWAKIKTLCNGYYYIKYYGVCKNFLFQN